MALFISPVFKTQNFPRLSIPLANFLGFYVLKISGFDCLNPPHLQFLIFTGEFLNTSVFNFLNFYDFQFPELPRFPKFPTVFNILSYSGFQTPYIPRFQFPKLSPDFDTLNSVLSPFFIFYYPCFYLSISLFYFNDKPAPIGKKALSTKESNPNQQSS